MENETLDDLQNGYFIYQPGSGFRFGVDAVLLADFAAVKAKRAVDLCSGTGIVPILLAAKTDIPHIDAVEIQHDIASLAAKSVSYNGLDGRINVIEGDLKDMPQRLGKGCYDVVTVNPPYMKHGGGIVNEGDMKAISRHEIKCTLDDVIRVSSELLTANGRFFIVHRPSRLADLFCGMRQYGIEPKAMRPVHPYPGKAMNLVLVMGMRNARPELKVMPPLYVYNGDGSYTKEIDEIYGR